MCKKLSITAELDAIEKEFERSFRFPRLYEPQTVVKGVDESLLPLITMNDPRSISYAIWGLLPEGYNEDWVYFQKAIDTLGVHKKDLEDEGYFTPSFSKRRCLVIVTGFFCYYLSNGTLYPYYVYQADKKPFTIAGLYNVLEDGFITCSLVTTSVSGVVREIQNVEKTMPVSIPNHLHTDWLNPSTPTSDLLDMLDNDTTVTLKAHSIAKEFFKNDIEYNCMLSPVHYSGTPGQL